MADLRARRLHAGRGQGGCRRSAWPPWRSFWRCAKACMAGSRNITWPELRSALILLAMTVIALPIVPDAAKRPLWQCQSARDLGYCDRAGGRFVRRLTPPPSGCRCRRRRHELPDAPRRVPSMQSAPAIASAPRTPPSRSEIAKVRIPAARLPSVSSRVRQPRSSPTRKPIASETARRLRISFRSMGCRTSDGLANEQRQFRPVSAHCEAPQNVTRIVGLSRPAPPGLGSDHPKRSEASQ